MNNFMLDLETLGLKSDSVILTIGIVQFDLKTGKTGAEVEIALDWQDQVNNRAKIDANTVKWWMEQEDAAIKTLVKKHMVTVKRSAEIIKEFFDKNCKDLRETKLWGNGVSFDNVMLRNLYARHDCNFPLPYWCDNDVRTLVTLCDINPSDYPFTGIKHNAIDDCKHQIKYCCDGYEKLTMGDL